MQTIRLIGTLALVGLFLLLSACGGGGSPRPTPQPVTGGIGGAEDPNASPVAVNVGSWQNLPGLGPAVSIGANGDAYVIGMGKDVWRWNGTGWDRQADINNAVRLAVAPNGQPWVVREDSSIARLVNGAWQTVPGQALALAIGANGDVYKTNPDRRNFGDGLSRFNGTDWTVVSTYFATRGDFNPLAVGPDGTPHISFLGATQRFVNGGWQDLPFGAAQGSLSIGANGDLWSVGPQGVLKLENGRWVQVTAGFVGRSVAVAPDGVPWVTDTNNGIWRAVVAAPQPPATIPNLTVVPSPTAPAAPQPNTRANVNLLCKFADNPAEPRSSADVQGLFEGINAYVQDQSYGAAAFTSDTRGWFTLPRNRDAYLPGATNETYNTVFIGTTVPQVFQDCTDVAAQNGVNFANYSVVSVFINTDFRMAGATLNAEGFILPRTVGGREVTAIIYDARAMVSPGLVAHELGHMYRDTSGGRFTNTGGHPASQWDAVGNTPLGRGNDLGGLVGFNAHTRDRAGWIPASLKFNYQGGARQITLARLTEPGPTGFRMAVIPIGNTGTYYTVEARVRVGFDAFSVRQGTNTPILPADSVVIHLVNPNDNNSADRAVLPPGVTDTFSPDGIWPTGSVMRDPANNLQIRVDALDQNGATVSIAPLQ